MNSVKETYLVREPDLQDSDKQGRLSTLMTKKPDWDKNSDCESAVNESFLINLSLPERA